MKKNFLFFLIASMTLVVSCGKKTDSNDLQHENDSLRAMLNQNMREMDENLAFLNEIDEGFRSIREQEKFVTIQSADPEKALTQKDRLLNDVKLITETLQKSRTQLDNLKRRLESSNSQSKELMKTIERMQKDIDEKSNTILTLQAELEKRNIKIDELDRTVGNLNKRLNVVSTESSQQKEVISEQDKSLNKAWYAVGSSSELKKWGIMTGGSIFKKSEVLKGEINKDFFIEIDLRKLEQIELFSKKGKLLTNHPAESYELKTGDDKFKTLVIKDPAKFWSLTRYLVVQTN